MADIAAANVTVTVEDQNIVLGKRRNRVKIVFGDGALTYPSGGVPMPGFASFGMVRNLDYLTVFDDDDASGLLFKYDRENNKLRIYWPTGGANNPSAAAAEANPIVMSGGASATAVDATTPALRGGQARELASATSTITAKTLYAEAVGW